MNRTIGIIATLLFAHLFFRAHPGALFPAGPFVFPRAEDGELLRTWLWNGGLLLQFFVLHSVLASRDRRLFIASTFFATALLWSFWTPFPRDYLSLELPAIAGIALLLVQSIGLVGFTYSLASIDVKAFLGDAPERENEFVASGAYLLCRHPMLFFLTLLLVFPSWSAGRLLVCASSVAYIAVGIFLEERKNKKKWGESYRAYQATTPMFFPTPKSIARFAREAHFPNPRVSRSK